MTMYQKKIVVPVLRRQPNHALNEDEEKLPSYLAVRYDLK